MKILNFDEFLSEKEKTEPKYKVGDKVYSYQNKSEPGKVNKIRISYDSTYAHAYRLTLFNGQNSKWIDEHSLSFEPINESEIIDTNSEKFLKPLLPKFKEAIKGDWEFKGFSINYHDDKSNKWAQIMLIDDPPTKVTVKVGNLETDPFGKRPKEENFKLENFDEILEYLKNNF